MDWRCAESVSDWRGITIPRPFALPPVSVTPGISWMAPSSKEHTRITKEMEHVLHYDTRWNPDLLQGLG